VVVIGLQLLPAKGVENFQFRSERFRPVVIAGGLAILILYVGATVPSQGVAPFIYFRF
jgi:alginate O-acetyltransferase complex protein AlgI